MPKYIVETNFFVDASDEHGAKFLVESALKMAEVNGWAIPEFRVAWVERQQENVSIIRRVADIFPRRGAA